MLKYSMVSGGVMVEYVSHITCFVMFLFFSSRLMVYPPPPAKGGILVTNEDLHCLNDGEFLNDVIIDFYLK